MEDIFGPGLLKGRVALVTGGGTGIGLSTATLLSTLGAHVVLAGRREDVVRDAADNIVAQGNAASSVQLDVRDYEQVAATIAGIVKDQGGLDILVNNAAGNFRCATEELSPNGWRTVVDIDLHGTFNCTRAAFDALSASPYTGRVVSIITSYGWSGWPGCAPAAAAKAGIQSLMRTLAVEWGDRNILCNSVAPGAIGDTEGAKRIHDDVGRGDHELSRVPVGRYGERDDIAAAVAYLVSPAGRYVNGTDLVVDGGRQFSFGTA
ncbi:SDR family oxidoreductase [Rhodococcus opacus]|uniref:SDR family oxidoreductase n=1 Tax=Rhodococcus opacus TaxID=37919 RepID=UPI001C452D4F|nr:SDR family oxidoreductase [Rhodococcus opacus]MBV6756705.1 SDR family oxidoreductase [Rhodococcus opacus]